MVNVTMFKVPLTVCKKPVVKRLGSRVTPKTEELLSPHSGPVIVKRIKNLSGNEMKQ